MTPDVLENSLALVVDDHPDSIQFLLDALESVGMRVLVATSGNQALQQIEHLIPDVILLDAIMPGLDGFETCRSLKKGLAAEVPVIFMTGLGEVEHIVKGLEVGGVDYLTKPINTEELIARIRTHLNRARQAKGVRDALDVSGRTMLATDIDGNVNWATPQAEKILLKLSPAPPLATQRPYTHETSVPTHNILKLPPSVFQWLNQPPKPKTDKSIHQDHLTLSLNHLKIRFRVLSRVSDNEILLVIQEVQSETVERNGIAKLQSRLNLTSREAEVLYWLCMGKANRDIADILGISYRTVDKHLEHLFVKINVESRASAVASSVRILED